MVVGPDTYCSERRQASLARQLEAPEVLLASCPTDVKTWARLVDESNTPDVYFRPGYAGAYSDNHSTALALTVHTSRRHFLLPLLIREVVAAGAYSSVMDFDAITPYGYGGVLPLDRGPITGEDAEELIQHLRDWCLKTNLVSCMLRLHPLLAQHSAFDAAAAKCHGGAVTHFGPTAAIDLLAWDDHLCAPSSMRRGRRSDLSHARHHLSVKVMSCDTPEAEELLEQFRWIYDVTMLRLNARPFYSFSNQYYTSLRQALQSHLAVAVAYHGTQPVGAALFLADVDFGHYHLGGVTHEGRQHKAQTAVLVEGAQWLRRRGCRWLHLGGGRAPGDSLYQFKHSFGARTFHSSNLTLIANKRRYSELVHQRRTERPLVGPATDFFPAYRAAEFE